MREITYSQGVTISDSATLSTLAVFCDRVWLPSIQPAEAVAEAFEAEVHSTGAWPKGEAIVKAIRSDESVSKWEEQYRPLFEANVLRRLPQTPGSPNEHNHRGEFDGKSIDEVFGAGKSVYERIALRYHLLRTDLPGAEFFESGADAKSVDLAKAVFHIQLPKISADPDRILEVREAAQKSNIGQFWEMIDEQAMYAEAEGKSAINRAEKIRAEFKKWKDDFFKFRGVLAGAALLTTLCWYSSTWTPLLAFAAMSSLGDVNRWWLTTREKEHKAFRFISKLDEKLQN